MWRFWLIVSISMTVLPSFATRAEEPGGANDSYHYKNLTLGGTSPIRPDNTSTGLGIDIARAELDFSKRIEKLEPKIVQLSPDGKQKKETNRARQRLIAES